MTPPDNDRQWISRPHCQKCGTNYDEPYLWCPDCQNLISIDPIQGPPKNQISCESLWSFAPFLPTFSSRISLHEGATPIIALSNFPELQGLKVKLEFRNPTGSFRDRACALLVSDAKSTHKTHIIGASTGSYGISLSAYGAKGQIKITNFVPSNLELSKIEQMKMYGSQVINTQTLDSATEQAKTLIERQKAYSPNPNENLLTLEGQKTIGLELAYELENIENIVIPMGSGSLIISIYRGLLDAQASGWIKEIPRIYAVSLDPDSNVSLIESLERGEPRLKLEVSRILQLTKGQEFIIDALDMLKDAIAVAKSEGLFIEPGSASVLSAAKRLKEENKDINLNNTVAILSGSGLNAMNIFAIQRGGTKKVVWGLSETSTTRYKILNFIATQQANYAPAIANIFGKTPSLQAVYQHLANLEKEGLIEDQTPHKKRKSYILSKKGQELLENLQNIIDLRNL